MKKVSIICAFRNEIKTLDECLKSLLNQNYKEKEIILVGDGSTDGSERIARGFAKRFKFVKYYKIKHLDNYGCVRPRMEAIKHAKGRIIFIVDADAKYASNYLSHCAKHLNEKNAGVIGKLRVWNPDNFISKYRDALYRLRYDDEKNIKREIKDNKIAAWVIIKKVYDDVGGYKLKESYSEDIDLAKRIMDTGYNIIYEPKALWWHRWKDEFILSIKNSYKIGYLKGNDSKNFNIKMFYFFTFPFLIILSFFNINFIAITLLHIIPSIFRSLILFYKTYRKGYENSFYSLYFLIISYMHNLALVAGFSVRLFSKNKIQ